MEHIGTRDYLKSLGEEAKAKPSPSAAAAAPVDFDEVHRMALGSIGGDLEAYITAHDDTVEKLQGMDLVRRFQILDTWRKNLEAVVEAIKLRIKGDEDSGVTGIMQKAIDWMTSQGLIRMRLNDETIYFHEQVWASAAKITGNRDADNLMMIDALRNTRFTVVDPATGVPGEWYGGDMVKETVNAQTLSAWVREIPVDPATLKPMLPDNLAACLSITKKPDLRRIKGR